MMNWYRALFISGDDGYDDATVQPKTMILWGEADQFLQASMATLSLQYCADGQLHLFPGVSHWLQHEEATAVNNHMVDFFTK